MERLSNRELAHWWWTHPSGGPHSTQILRRLCPANSEGQVIFMDQEEDQQAALGDIVGTGLLCFNRWPGWICCEELCSESTAPPSGVTQIVLAIEDGKIKAAGIAGGLLLQSLSCLSGPSSPEPTKPRWRLEGSSVSVPSSETRTAPAHCEYYF